MKADAMRIFDRVDEERLEKKHIIIQLYTLTVVADWPQVVKHPESQLAFESWKMEEEAAVFLYLSG